MQLSTHSNATKKTCQRLLIEKFTTKQKVQYIHTYITLINKACVRDALAIVDATARDLNDGELALITESLPKLGRHGAQQYKNDIEGTELNLSTWFHMIRLLCRVLS